MMREEYMIERQGKRFVLYAGLRGGAQPGAKEHRDGAFAGSYEGERRGRDREGRDPYGGGQVLGGIGDASRRT